MSDTPGEKTEQRRKLLKKAAMVPAVFLLPSTGRAQALSSVHACVYRGLVNGEAAKVLPGTDPGNPPHDVWVREYRHDPNFPERSGSYLVYDPVTNERVAHHSCWNSIRPHGERAAGPDNLLIP